MARTVYSNLCRLPFPTPTSRVVPDLQETRHDLIRHYIPVPVQLADGIIDAWLWQARLQH